MRWFVVLAGLILSLGTKAEERIVSFHSAVQIEKNGGLAVTETIEAQVEHRQIRRGILRDFPTDYRDRLGRSVTVPFEVVSVKRDGNPEPWAAEGMANGVRVRIGSANVVLPQGRHVWEIKYRTDFQLGFFEAHDELYWNVNGNGWTFAMDEISADVFLPAPVPVKEVRAEAYTGRFGARGRDYAAETRDWGARFRTTRRLAAGEGLTVVVMFPKGLVAQPTWRQKLGRWLHDNRGEVAGAGGILLLALFLFWRWRAVGRDPREGPLFPRYEAPQGLGPAGVRYLDRMQCDDRCFAAALLGLGQRGYLRIREEPGGLLRARSYRIEPRGSARERLPGEQPIVSLLARGPRVISATHDPEVQAAREGVGEALKRHFGEKLFSRNLGSFFVGVLLGGGTLAVMIAMVAATPVLIGAGVVVLALLAAAWKLLPAYTAEGRRLEDEVEGLRQYLGVAESDDLARQKRPPRTKEEFAKFLPYAVALGVEKTWADAFAKVLGAAALAAATADYYSSDSGSSIRDAGHFADSIADMGRTISAASTPPGSSSGGSDGGGGGSSGGGGGGGGGSGW